MKSHARQTKSGSFEPLKIPTGKVRKIKSMRPELPESQYRKIPGDDGVPRRSPRLLDKNQISMGSAPESSRTKRRVLTDAPVNVKRFKPSEGSKSIQDLEADRDDILKDANFQENKAVEAVKYILRSGSQQVLTLGACTSNKDVKGFDPEVKGPAETCHEVTNNDGTMECDLDTVSMPTCINESGGILLQNHDQEMEDDDIQISIDSADAFKDTIDLDMSLQSMASSSQIIRDVGVNETSLDDSILAGPSNRVENSSASSLMMPQDSERIHCQRVTKIKCIVPAADGKETVLTHEPEPVRNYTLQMSSGDDALAPTLSCPDGDILESLVHDEGDEELERFMLAIKETNLRMQQCNSVQSCWNHIEDYSEFVIISAMVLIFFILFISEAFDMRSSAVPFLEGVRDTLLNYADPIFQIVTNCLSIFDSFFE